MQWRAPGGGESGEGSSGKKRQSREGGGPGEETEQGTEQGAEWPDPSSWPSSVLKFVSSASSGSKNGNDADGSLRSPVAIVVYSLRCFASGSSRMPAVARMYTGVV